MLRHTTILRNYSPNARKSFYVDRSERVARYGKKINFLIMEQSTS